MKIEKKKKIHNSYVKLFFFFHAYNNVSSWTILMRIDWIVGCVIRHCLLRWKVIGYLWEIKLSASELNFILLLDSTNKKHFTKYCSSGNKILEAFADTASVLLICHAVHFTKFSQKYTSSCMRFDYLRQKITWWDSLKKNK